MAAATEWKPFYATYTYRGKEVVHEEAYLTITVPLRDDEETRQIVVLPTCGYCLARWMGRGPVDYAKLRERALTNVKKLESRLSDSDLDCYD